MLGNGSLLATGLALAEPGLGRMRTETCPPGMKTGDHISPPACYVGGGLQSRPFLDASGPPRAWARQPMRYGVNWHEGSLICAQAKCSCGGSHE